MQQHNGIAVTFGLVEDSQTVDVDGRMRAWRDHSMSIRRKGPRALQVGSPKVTKGRSRSRRTVDACTRDDRQDL